MANSVFAAYCIWMAASELLYQIIIMVHMNGLARVCLFHYRNLWSYSYSGQKS